MLFLMKPKQPFASCVLNDKYSTRWCSDVKGEGNLQQDYLILSTVISQLGEAWDAWRVLFNMSIFLLCDYSVK